MQAQLQLSIIAHPAFLLGGLSVYSLIAWDVFAPDAPHLLQPLDAGLHAAVQENLDPAVRQILSKPVSNFFLVAASVGWIFATAAALSRRNPRAWAGVGLGWALWAWGVGPIQHDPLLMDVLKNTFGRARPSPIHSSASFPSGHLASDVLLVGGLLFVILPLVYGSWEQRARQEGQRQEEEGGSAGGASVAGLLMTAIDWSQQHAGPLLGMSVAVTLAGRVGADAHWLSDTLAGAGLGLALVSGWAGAMQRMGGGAGAGGHGVAGKRRGAGDEGEG
ncbi:hypothetical protein HYH03_004097 [Edaphochlamys debaryana]|uniref:Phosphatidic acid phosphatase type 2/haloperoxidase domain-containing protein n=1 Tax=Edaphochlamys debaryana TaxID=47281 RepID=A0A835YAA8_9CHLO|nr:hypothetical protein HYH03_004097 [Edaphochlamys debaryana]|eukprot:KAG2497827.1 hypothetical protein HYH03_004097 [Edaphochlamys debaryana]